MRAQQLLSVRQRLCELVTHVKCDGPEYIAKKELFGKVLTREAQFGTPSWTKEIDEAINYFNPGCPGVAEEGGGKIFSDKLKTQASLAASAFINFNGQDKELDIELLEEFC